MNMKYINVSVVISPVRMYRDSNVVHLGTYGCDNEHCLMREVYAHMHAHCTYYGCCTAVTLKRMDKTD